MPLLSSLRLFVATLALVGAVLAAQSAAAEPVKVKVFVAAMFEIGKNTGDRAGEFQHWYERYWMDSPPMPVRGALNPVFCNADGICGAILGMGKVASSSSMQAILLNPQFDFSQTYYILSGVAGIPPSRGTIGEVVWATWLVDYDLGHRWAADEVKPGEPLFMPRKGYESIRVYHLNLEASVRSAAQSERSYGADLIEAGLNEGAGRFALAPLWALFTSLGLVSWR